MLNYIRTKQKAVRIFLTLQGLPHEGRCNSRTEGGDSMTVFEAIMIMLTFGLLIVNIFKLVLEIVKNKKR